MDVNIQMIKIHLHVYVLISFIFTNTNNRVIVNHLGCKHRQKIPPHVTPLCLQSRTTIHTNIHPYALVHTTLPIKPIIWISLHFSIHISSTRRQIFSHHSQKLYKCMKTWQRHITLLKTQDGDLSTTRNVLVNSFHIHSTIISVQVNYTEIWNNLSLQKNIYLVYFLQSSLRIFKSGYPVVNIVINSRPSSCAIILCINLLSTQFLMRYGHPTTIYESSAGTMKGCKNGHIDASPILTIYHVRATSTTKTYLQVSPI